MSKPIKAVRSGGKRSTTSERLTVVETDLAALRSEVHSFAKSMNEDFRALSDKISQANARNDEAVSKITDTLSQQGRIQPGTIIGVVGALATWSVILAGGVWFLVGLGHEPTEVRQQMLMADYQAHKENHGHPKMVADVAAIEQQIEAASITMVTLDERLDRMEEWYNGHGQRMAQDIIRVEAHFQSLAPQVAENSVDAIAIENRLVKQIESLESRMREDYPPKWLTEKVDLLHSLLINVITTRFSPEDAADLLRQIQRDLDRIEGRERDDD